jgi:hypothetical protein
VNTHSTAPSRGYSSKPVPHQASAFCFNEYGGRLPSPHEFIIAGSAVGLTFDVNADWTSDLSATSLGYSTVFTVKLGGEIFDERDRREIDQGTRCWIPREALSVAGVPAIMPWGLGLLVALMLSAAGGALLLRGRPLLTSGGRGISRRW